MPVFQGIAVADLTAPTLLGLTVLLFLLGWIVPRKTLTDKSKEAERWRLAYEAEREARAIADRHSVELLELAKTTNAIISSAFGPRGALVSQEKPDEAIS